MVYCKCTTESCRGNEGGQKPCIIAVPFILNEDSHEHLIRAHEIQIGKYAGKLPQLCPYFGRNKNPSWVTISYSAFMEQSIKFHNRDATVNQQTNPEPKDRLSDLDHIE